MEGIFMGQITGSCSRISEEDGKRCAQVCFHDTESNACSKLSHYNKTYSLVLSDDVIMANDELLKLREKVAELEEELIEIKTTRTLREAYITGVEKGCESLREDRDTWKRRWNSVVTDIGKSLEANGIKFTLKEVHGNGNWDVVIDIPELNEAKKKVEDLEKKLKAAKSNETFWRNRKEEEEDQYHYWLHTFDRAVKQAADKGIHIGVCGSDKEDNVGIVTVYNMKAEELETRVVALEKTNNNLDQKIGAADNALEYWNNTYNDIVIAGKKVGVKIDIKGKKPDSNAGFVYVTNEKAKDLEKQVVETFANLEKRLADTKSKETYWQHTFNRAVTQAEQKGVYIGVSGNDEENNAGVVIVDNGKANELESQVVQMEDANQKLRQRISAADEEIEELKSQYTSRPATGWRNTYYSAVEKAKAEGVTIELQDWDLKVNVARLKVMNHRAANLERQIKRLEDDNAAKGDHWKRNYEELTEYWDNTYKDIVAAGKEVGVKIDLKGRKPDGNIGTVYITNEKALELMVNVSDTKHEYNKKWQAMLNALKAKGVEVIYMGEQDSKPIIDVKIPGWEMDKQWVKTFSKQCADLRADKFGLESERDELKEQCDILRKDGVLKGQQCIKLTEDLNALKKEYGRVISELAELKRETVAEVRYEFRPNCLTIIYTKCDGSKQTISMDSSEAIDANSISCGTVPKCESCKNHRYFTNGGHYCYLPDSEYKISGMFRCHSLTEEEAEGPACSDFKARKE